MKQTSTKIIIFSSPQKKLREQAKVDDAETGSDGIEISLGVRVLLLGAAGAAAAALADGHGEVERQDEVDPLLLYSVQRQKYPYVVHGRRVELLDGLLPTEDDGRGRPVPAPAIVGDRTHVFDSG